MSTVFRNARLEDLPEILAIYARARQFMKETGNPTQWGDTHPTEAAVREDIALQRSYVCEIDGQVEGVFMLAAGRDPTYEIIEDGAWHSDAPYHTIHRIASSGRVNGVFSLCVDWCYETRGYLRIDTHHNNKVMQHLIAKKGFVRSGIIYQPDGSPRIAYEKFSDLSN